MAIFEDVIELQAPIDRVFAFFSQPQNVVAVSSPDMGLSLKEGPEEIHEGARVTFQLQAFGQVRDVVYRITEFNPPHRFVEVQESGPLKTWRHDHLFEETPTGTRVKDVIEFQPPGGLVGFLLTEDKIRDGLADAFFHRKSQLRRVFAESAS